MRITAPAAVAVLAAMPVYAQQDPSFPERRIAICLEGPYAAPEVVLARSHATRILSRIGIATEWHWNHRACETGDRPAFLITLVEDATPGFHPGALAASQPFEGVHIRIFRQRLRQRAGDENLPQLLGYVFVHELTHMLLGSDVHSEEGVMKASWAQSDIDLMRQGKLAFTVFDVRHILNELDRWNSHKQHTAAALRKGKSGE